MPVTKKSIAINANVKNFLEYIPTGWDGKTKLPLIVSSHGYGHVGTDANVMLGDSLPMYLNKGLSTPQAIVLMPQYSQAWPAWFVLDGVIEYAFKNYPIDQDRVYLTGLSMGGAITTDYSEGGAAVAKKIAAILPVCTASVYQPFGLNWVTNNVPAYFACGNLDSFYQRNQAWVAALNASNINPPAKLYTVTGEGHNCWNTVYDPTNKAFGGLNAVDWLMSKVRAGAVTPPVASVEAEFSFPGGKYTLYTDKTWSK